ncbi:MAG TPA: tetratricopeptide repeat protein [Opitutaceae bacterium]|nr:tetratricopeptide repeat protein [Opitutaceae bacterium]
MTRNGKAAAAVLLLVAAWFVYAPAMHGGWVWDDPQEVADNYVLRDPRGLPRIWLAPAGVDYFPLKTTVQWFAWRLWGDDPFGYHLLNVALHLAAALLFWRVLRKLNVPTFGAWAGALLFVVHPLAVESVAWISELKNTLSLSLLLAAMLAYLDFDEREGRGAYALALGWFLLALLAKSAVVMFPAVILLHAWWRRGRIGARDLSVSAPFFVLSLVLGLVTAWFQHTRSIAGAALHSGGLAARLGAAGLSLWFYLLKSLVPFGLEPIYPRWNLSSPAAGLVAWAALALWLFWLATRRRTYARHLLFGLGFFALNLAPVLGLVPIAYLRISWVADHFAYLSLLGPVGLAAAAFGAWHEGSGQGARIASSVGLATLAGVLALAAREYDGIFRDERTFWSYALAHNPQAWMAHNNLGRILYLDGRKEEAAEHFRRAVAGNPDDAQSHFNLGLTLDDAGRADEAIAEFRTALALKPAFPAAQNSLGNALLRRGRRAEAIGLYRAALATDPGFPEAHCNLGIALAEEGRPADAVPEFERAIALRPGYFEPHYNLGLALEDLGRGAEAIAQYEQARTLRPDHPGVRYNLANALAAAGRTAEAVAEYRESLRLDPGFADAHNNLGVALASLGRDQEAKAQLEEALRLKPDYPDARANLAKLQGGGSAAP